MRSSLVLIAALAAAVSAARCSGGGNSPQSPTTPGSTTPSTLTVSIVGTMGNSSYVPNPVQKAAGDQLAFRNNDTINTHHILMKDRKSVV